jgi:hypothetical protein
MIVASNVLHVTADLGKSLHGLKKLLKPGGKLIMHEIVRPENIPASFVFGLLPGWWLAAKDGRSMSPVIDEAQWDALLVQSNFSGADFCLRDYTDQDAHSTSIICATAVKLRKEDYAFLEATIVMESETSLRRHLADIVTSQLSSCGFHSTQIITLSDSAQDGVLSHSSAIVRLFDTEIALLSRLDIEKFRLLKNLVTSTRKILWVSNGGGHSVDPSHGMIDGFAKIFHIEQPQSKLTILALEGIEKDLRKHCLSRKLCPR